jgi:dTDP-4-amino-4,6-dideoxygalactose transaminase
MSIPFYMHDLGQEELNLIGKVLQSPILTTGEYVENFEARFSEFLRCKYSLGVTSCTGALHMSLLALGIKNGDEVITTPMTFIATACAILEAGAKPIFVDVEADTGNLDASSIEGAITNRTKAILPVHLYGQMCDMRKIREIADKYNLNIIEDAAHCIEGERDGIKPGQLSDAACFSFYATKNITCGEGGAVVTNRKDLYERLRLLRLHGMTKTAFDRSREGYKHWDMVSLGWKYNLDNIQAAILLPQMERLQKKLQKRNDLAKIYDENLSKIKGLYIPAIREGVVHARHLYPIWVPANIRDVLIRELAQMGISTVVNYQAIHLLSYLKEHLMLKDGDFPNAEGIGRKTLSLPFYPTMPIEHIFKVVNSLEQILGRLEMNDSK